MNTKTSIVAVLTFAASAWLASVVANTGTVFSGKGLIGFIYQLVVFLTGLGGIWLIQALVPLFFKRRDGPHALAGIVSGTLGYIYTGWITFHIPDIVDAFGIDVLRLAAIIGAEIALSFLFALAVFGCLNLVIKTANADSSKP
jgi:hypothetical protein